MEALSGQPKSDELLLESLETSEGLKVNSAFFIHGVPLCAVVWHFDTASASLLALLAFLCATGKWQSTANLCVSSCMRLCTFAQS